MTATLDSAFDSVAAFVSEIKTSRAEVRAEARKTLERMSQTMIEEEGLLNHAQAAVVLGVSVKRVGELVRNRKLSRFDFFERTYVSLREVRERDQEELKAGRRKPRTFAQQVIMCAKGALENDPLQEKVGGPFAPKSKLKKK